MEDTTFKTTPPAMAQTHIPQSVARVRLRGLVGGLDGREVGFDLLGGEGGW